MGEAGSCTPEGIAVVVVVLSLAYVLSVTWIVAVEYGGGLLVTLHVNTGVLLLFFAGE